MSKNEMTIPSKNNISQIVFSNKLFFIFGILVVLLYALIVVALPLVSQFLIDELLGATIVSQVYTSIIVFFVVCMLQPLLYFIKERIFIALSENVSYKLRIKLFYQLSILPIEYYSTHNYGEISTKIISDSLNIGSFVYTICNGLIASVISILCIVVAMFLQSIILSTIILIAVVIYVVVSFFVSKRFQSYSSRGIALAENMQNSIKTSFDNIILTKTFLIEKHHNQKFDTLVTNTKHNNLKIRKISSLFNVVNMAISTLALSIIYGIGALMVIDKTMSLGTVIAMGLFFQSLSIPITQLISSNISYNQVKPCIKRISNLLDETSESGDIQINPQNLSIKMTDVCFQYPDSDNPILNKFNLEISSAGKYGIIGHSGCGKSTVAKLILGLYGIESGNIQVFGENIVGVDKNSLRNNISYVEQETELLNDSILSNLTVGNILATKEEVIQACKLIGIHDKIIALDDGYDSILSDKVNLSVGEKRRISIARALLKKAQIYIFDEPEVSIEEEFKDALLKIFDSLSKDKIVLVITHNSDLLESFHSKIYIEHFAK